MRLGLPDDSVEAAEVGPLVGVEGEDSEQRGYSLPVIPRERCNQKCPETATVKSPCLSEISSSP
jgi:hypothetical protein